MNFGVRDTHRHKTPAKEGGWRPKNLHGKKWDAVGIRTDEKNKIFSGKGRTKNSHLC